VNRGRPSMVRANSRFRLQPMRLVTRHSCQVSTCISVDPSITGSAGLEGRLQLEFLSSPYGIRLYSNIMGGPPPRPNMSFFVGLMVSEVTLDVLLHQGARLKVDVRESVCTSTQLSSQWSRLMRLPCPNGKKISRQQKGLQESTEAKPFRARACLLGQTKAVPVSTPVARATRHKYIYIYYIYIYMRAIIIKGNRRFLFRADYSLQRSKIGILVEKQRRAEMRSLFWKCHADFQDDGSKSNFCWSNKYIYIYTHTYIYIYMYIYIYISS